MKKHRLVWFLIGMIGLSIGLAPAGFAQNGLNIRINIPEYHLYLYNGTELIQMFDVAIGKPKTPSPVGEFQVVNKTPNPTWYPLDGGKPVLPGPANPLGKYWLGLNIVGYGIHGNIAEWSIGNSVSNGCFRMHNSDIVRLYNMVPVGTPVQIVYQTVTGNVDKNNQAWLQVYPDIYSRSNMDKEVSRVIGELNWGDKTHFRALSELLKARKPIKIQVPRLIRVEGDVAGNDGFFWNNEVYLSRTLISQLGVKIDPVLNNATVLFNGYYKQSALSQATDGQLKFVLDLPNGVLKIYRLKVVINGKEVANVGRWGSNQRIFLDLSKLAMKLESDFTWDHVSDHAVCLGNTISGELKEGDFWVDCTSLRSVWSELGVDWDESTWTLKLMTSIP